MADPDRSRRVWEKMTRVEVGCRVCGVLDRETIPSILDDTVALTLLFGWSTCSVTLTLISCICALSCLVESSAIDTVIVEDGSFVCDVTASFGGMILDPDWNLNKRIMANTNGNARVTRVRPFGLDNGDVFSEEDDRWSKAPKLRDEAKVDESLDMVVLMLPCLLLLSLLNAGYMDNHYSRRYAPFCCKSNQNLHCSLCVFTIATASHPRRTPSSGVLFV